MGEGFQIAIRIAELCLEAINAINRLGGTVGELHTAR